MKKLLPVIFLFVLSSVVFAQSPPPPPPFNQIVPPPLSNQDVIEMSKAKLPDTVIISKIKASKVQFQTDIEALKTLNAEKVPASVVSAMIEKSVEKPAPVVEQKIEIAPTIAPTVAPIPEAIKTLVKSNEKVFTPQPNPDFSEATEKQRYKQPAQIQIGAPAEQVSELLIRAFQSWNYQLDDSSNRRLVFSKEVPGLGNQILAGLASGDTNARYQIQVTLSELTDSTNVIINMSLRSQNAFGRVKNDSLNNKKTRRQLDDLLLAVKN